MSLPSSALLLSLVLLSLGLPRVAGFFTFQAYNDSGCSQPLSRERFPVIDLPNTDFVFGQTGYDQCVIAPSPNISALVYRCTAQFLYLNVYTLPTLLNDTFCPTPYLATPRTVQISSASGTAGPVQEGGSCWQLTYNHVDHTSGRWRHSNIYGDVTCGTGPGNQPNGAAAADAQHTLAVVAAAATASLTLML